MMSRPCLPRTLRDRRGAMIVEYAIVAPVFIVLLVALLSLGVNGFYQLCLDDSVRDAARQLQLGGPASSSGAGFVAAVCSEFGKLADDCSTSITYAVQANGPTQPFASLTPAAPLSGGQFSDAFPTGLGANDNVLLQVSYPLPLVVPYLVNVITLTSTNAILAAATVRMEPLN